MGEARSNLHSTIVAAILYANAHSKIVQLSVATDLATTRISMRRSENPVCECDCVVGHCYCFFVILIPNKKKQCIEAPGPEWLHTSVRGGSLDTFLSKSTGN